MLNILTLYLINMCFIICDSFPLYDHIQYLADHADLVGHVQDLVDLLQLQSPVHEVRLVFGERL